jgi:uncharacterized protein YhbP (UPF0306 family)
MTNELVTRQIIDENTYMTLATSVDDNPWACALFMGVDEQYHLYFVSNIQTTHVQNVLKNKHVSVVVFDSHAISGEANGVQLTGSCRRLVGEEVQRGIDAIYTKRYPDPAERAQRNLTVEEFSRPDTDPTARHIYEITPEHVYVLDKQSGEDAQVEIDLGRLGSDRT